MASYTDYGFSTILSEVRDINAPKIFYFVVVISGDLKAIYTLTSTEQNEFGKSVWLNVWTEEDLKIMEYAADLKVEQVMIRIQGSTFQINGKNVFSTTVLPLYNKFQRQPTTLR